MRILLAEDDPLLGDGLRAGLRQLGFLVDWVRDGVAAERELRTHPYAAAVLDLGLPQKDGMAVLQDLRRAGIEPWAWVINRSLSATSTEDPVLAARLRNERRQFKRVESLSRRLAIIPWLAQPPVGLDALDAMTSAPPRAQPKREARPSVDAMS